MVNKRKSKSKDKKYNGESKVKSRFVKPAPISKRYAGITLDKVRENMIETGRLDSITTKMDGKIKIERSWIELCISFLGTIHSRYRSSFIKKLFENGVISSDFDITATRPVYIDDKVDKLQYNIAGTNFWLITNMNSKSVIKAIKGMAKLLDIKKEDISMDIYPIGLEVIDTDDEGRELVIGKDKNKMVLEKGVYDLIKAKKQLNNFTEINSISILGVRYDVDKFIGAVMVFVSWVSGVYGIDNLFNCMVCNTTSVGIVDNDKIECINIYEMGTSEDGKKTLYLYNNNSKKDCLKFITNLAKRFEINEGLIELELSNMEYME